MTVSMKIESHPDVINYFKELPFYNTYIEKPKFERLKNIDLFSEIPFYEELSFVKTDKAIRRYAMTYKVESINKKDPLSKLEASKSSIIDLFHDLSDQNKGFKYEITIKIFFKKYKGIEIEFYPVHFNSTTKTVINHKFDLDKSFQEILYRIDNWINEGSSGLLKRFILNTLTFQLLDHYQGVLTLNKLLN